MKTLFKSTILQRKFEQDGFVKIHLLNPAEVHELVNAYAPFRAAHEKINLPYITTSHSSDPTLITAVDEALQKIIAPAIDKHLTNYELLFGNFLVKMPLPNSATDPHQDITFVDEEQHLSVNIWIALEDINKQNGGMYFLPGSHNFMPNIRPTHDYVWPYENVKSLIKKKAIAFSAKAGDAFIFNHAIIHGSFANLSSKYRLAAVVAAYTKEASLIHYFLPKNSVHQLKKFSMTKEAYLYFEKEKPPRKGTYVEDQFFSSTTVTPQLFELFMTQHKLSFLSRLKQLFS